MQLGVVGLGPAWETRYLPALETLRNRVRIAAVYDPVALRAEQAAEQLEAEPVEGLWALICRPAVQAVLILDRMWLGCAPLKFAVRAQKPAYVAGDWSAAGQTIHVVSKTASASGLTLMPELRQRYVPSTARLKELLATRLGPAQRLVIDVQSSVSFGDSPAGPAEDLLVHLFDWCRYVVRSHPVQILCQSESAQPSERRIEITYAAGKDAPEGIVAILRLRNGLPENRSLPDDEQHAVRYEIFCRDGQAVLESPEQITWINGDEMHTENLMSERPAEEVMLDHFCRRVAGGLLPVTDIGDICRGLEIAKAAAESATCGAPIRILGGTR